jgi:beta-glucosidase
MRAKPAMFESIIRRFPALCLATVGLSVSSLSPQTIPGGAATRPQGRTQEPAALKLHERHLARAKDGKIDLLFLGDSITQAWGENPDWSRYYASRNAANFGIGGDRTQHLLWRLDHGALEGYSPRVVVILIGTNNIGNTELDDLSEGVKAVVARVRAKLPKSRILLLGVFPRGAREEGAVVPQPDPRVAEINRRISEIADDRAVHYLDLSPAFLDGQNEIDRKLMPDLLHLSETGYAAWAEKMEPALWKLWEAPPLE